MEKANFLKVRKSQIRKFLDSTFFIHYDTEVGFLFFQTFSKHSLI